MAPRISQPASPRPARGRDRIPSVGLPRAGTAPVGAAGRGPLTPTRRRQRTGEDGFTLVELLVVVLVLGALVAIAVPTFIGQREAAWDAAVRSELRSAGVALESYRAQNGGYSPDALDPGSGWGYEVSGNLDLRTPTVTATSYCLIAQHASDSSPNPNKTWRVTQEGGVVRIDTASGSCTSAALP